MTLAELIKSGDELFNSRIIPGAPDWEALHDSTPEDTEDGEGEFEEDQVAATADTTAADLLKRMEQAGLLQRQRAKDDERRVQVCLTAQGQQLKTQAARIPGCVIAQTGCPIPELMSLTQQVQALRDRLTTFNPAPPPEQS